jgi:hypothetical protein
MTAGPIKQVGVFPNVPFRGNPVAVVPDASALDSGRMQRIANWTNLVRNVLCAAADPAGCGLRRAHFHAGRVSARVGTLMQECGAGLVKLSIDSVLRGWRSVIVRGYR